MREDGLEVFIRLRDTKEPLDEFPDPKGKPNKLYIMSTPGAKFSIIVVLHDDFNWHGAEGLNVSRAFDGGKVWHKYIKKSKVQRWPFKALEISKLNYQEDGKWLRGDLNFAEYQFDDITSLGADAWQDDSTRGTIEVDLQRIKSSQKVEWTPWRPDIVHDGKAPIKIVKDLGISHFVTVSDPIDNKKEGNRKRRNTPLKGQAGALVKFQFAYRPKCILRKLNLCPPSPIIIATEPMDLTNIMDDDEDDQDRVAECVDLTQKQSDAIIPLKRERDENNEDLEAELRRTKAEFEARLKSLGDRIRQKADTGNETPDGTGKSGREMKREPSVEL